MTGRLVLLLHSKDMISTWGIDFTGNDTGGSQKSNPASAPLTYARQIMLFDIACLLFLLLWQGEADFTPKPRQSMCVHTTFYLARPAHNGYVWLAPYDQLGCEYHVRGA